VRCSKCTAIPRYVHGVSWALLVIAVSATPMIGSSAQTKSGQKTKAGTKKAPEAPAVAGRKLFVNNCSACHGSSGQGGEGPNLHGLKLSDARITSTVNGGIKNEMPAFKSKLKTQEIKSLIAYIRTLKK
jgi:mono/diheme cytochrome c family protein